MEIFLYLGQYRPNEDWCAVAIFANRALDPGMPMQFRGFRPTQQVQWVYLDELPDTHESVALSIAQLVMATEEEAIEQTRQLFQKVRQTYEDVALQQNVLGLIETVLVYKFAQLSPQELEAMFGLNELRQTRYFQEVEAQFRAKGRQEGIQQGRQAS